MRTGAGLIVFTFLDKTGTLTKNEMQFERCSVNGSIFEEKDGYLYPASDGTIESPIDLKNCSVSVQNDEHCKLLYIRLILTGI